jgi:hypothetical protein
LFEIKRRPIQLVWAGDEPKEPDVALFYLIQGGGIPLNSANFATSFDSYENHRIY